jgi:hypothetical protein
MGPRPRNGNKTGGLALKARENHRCLLGVCYATALGNIFIYLSLLDHVHILVQGASHMTIPTVLRTLW